MHGVVSPTAAWLRDCDWSHWATLTYRKTPTPRSCRRHAERFFKRTGGIAWWCTERGAIGGRAHNHALLVLPVDVSPAACWDWWVEKHGRAQVEAYDPKKGAAHYVAKYITKAPDDWDLWLPNRT
jgi:hypothetical protein